MKRVLFMGTPDYATIIFKKLIESDYEVVGLFTQPDKKVGRKQVITPPHIKQYCIDENIELPIYQPNTLREEQVVEDIKSLKPDFIVVAAYGQILLKSILDIAPCINLHASLLPLYRGASPIQESILYNDEFTGVTSMLMEEGLDSGDILGLSYLKIDDETMIDKLFYDLSNIAADLTIDTLDRFEKIAPLKQDHKKATYCKKIKKDNGLVDFSDAKTLYTKYRAYKYWPGVFLESGLKLKEIAFNENDSINDEAKILEIAKDYAIIGCGKGSIKVQTIQAPSKKAVNIVDYLRGKRLELGDTLS